MATYPLRFTGWQPSAEGGWGVVEWELPAAICPRTKGAVPADEVLLVERRNPWGVFYEPVCRRCGAMLTDQAAPVDAAEREALRAKNRWWKGLR